MMRPGMDLRGLMQGANRERIRPEKNEWPFVIAGIILFFVSLIFYILEFNNFSSVIFGSRLMLSAVVLGLIFGLFLSSKLGKDAVGMEKVQVFAVILFMTTLSFPIYSHLANKYFSTSPVTWQEVTVVKNESFLHAQLSIPLEQTKGDGYYFNYLYNEREKYLRTDKPIFIDKGKGAVVQLPIRKGFLGFSFVDIKSI